MLLHFFYGVQLAMQEKWSKPHANGCNIVGDKLPTLLDVTCCICLHMWPCSMLFCAVGSCSAKFETGQTFSYVQTDTTTPNVVGPTMLGVVVSVCT